MHCRWMPCPLFLLCLPQPCIKSLMIVGLDAVTTNRSPSVAFHTGPGLRLCPEVFIWCWPADLMCPPLMYRSLPVMYVLAHWYKSHILCIAANHSANRATVVYKFECIFLTIPDVHWFPLNFMWYENLLEPPELAWNITVNTRAHYCCTSFNKRLNFSS